MSLQVKFISRAGLSLLLLGVLVALISSGSAQTVTAEKTVTVGKNVLDNGTLLSGMTWTNSGITLIDSVAVTLNMSSPFNSNPINLGDLSASLRHGASGESYRTGSLFSAGSMNSLAQTFTQGTSFDGGYLSSGYWNLAVNDVNGGGIARLDAWKLAVTGTPLASGTMDLGAGTVLAATAAGTTEVGAAVLSNGTGASAITLATDSGKNLNLSGGLSGSGNFSKTGEGTVRIGNSSGFSGRLEVGGGKAVIAGSLGSNSTVRVGAGGILSGTGTVSALEIASGGTLAVGNSPGQLNAGNTTWAGGATYAWEVDDFTGNDTDFLAGRGTNWDFLNVTGTLNVTATGGASRFIIDVISLLAADNLTKGAADEWDPLKGYSFSIATATGGIQIGGAGYGSYGSQAAFDSALNGLFDIRTTQFANATGSAALWSISTSAGGQNLLLNYNGGATAIPEPGSASLLVLGLVTLFARKRRGRG